MAVRRLLAWVLAARRSGDPIPWQRCPASMTDGTSRKDGGGRQTGFRVLSFFLTNLAASADSPDRLTILSSSFLDIMPALLC